MQRNKLLSFLVKASITIIILYLVLSSVPVEEYKRAWVLFSFNVLTGVLILVIAQVCLLAFRWYLLAKSAGSHLSIPTSIFGILISFFFSQGLPASIGGDAFRIWWHHKEGISASTGLKIIFFDRVYGMLALILLCLSSIFLLSTLLSDTAKITSLFLLVTIIGCLLGLMVMPWRVGISRLIKKFSVHMPSRVEQMFHWLVTTRGNLSQQNLLTTSALLCTGVLTHLLVVAQVYFVGHTLNPEKINLLMCLAVVPPALLVSYMPFSIAGWGVREASMVIAFGLLGVSASVAILISLVIGMTILAISLIGGMLWMMGGFRAAFVSTS